MSITAARLQAEVGADTKGFDRGMAHADQTIAKAPGKWSKALKLGAGAGLGIAAAVVVRGAVGGIQAGLASLREEGVVVAQTNAVIRSTKGAANVSMQGIRDLSKAVEDKTTIDDKAVQAGANMLLTFTNVRNEAGKGNDIFNQSVGILADMSTAMGTDMKGGAIQLGKALNDPLKGISALSRVGVMFDAQQEKRIKKFMKEGKVAEAQKIILAELNKEFGGSGAAFAATDTGKAAKFADALEGIQQSLSRALLPAISNVRDALTGFLNDPATMGQAEALGGAIAGIFSEGNLRTAASVMTTAAGAIGTAIKLFSGLPKEVQALAVGAIALKKVTGIGPIDIAKGAGGALSLIFKRGDSPANPMFVAQVGGGAAGATGAIGKGLSLVSKMFLVGEAIGLALLVNEIRNGIADGNSKTAAAIQDTSTKWLAQNPSKAELRNGLAAVEKGINDIQANPLNVLIQGDALDRLREMRDAINRQLAGATLASSRSPDAIDRAAAGARAVGRRLQAARTGGGTAAQTLAASFAASNSPSLLSMNKHLAKIVELQKKTKDPKEAALLADAAKRIQGILGPREKENARALKEVGYVTQRAGERTAGAARATTAAVKAIKVAPKITNKIAARLTINQRIVTYFNGRVINSAQFNAAYEANPGGTTGASRT